MGSDHILSWVYMVQLFECPSLLVWYVRFYYCINAGSDHMPSCLHLEKLLIGVCTWQGCWSPVLPVGSLRNHCTCTYIPDNTFNTRNNCWVWQVPLYYNITRGLIVWTWLNCSLPVLHCVYLARLLMPNLTSQICWVGSHNRPSCVCMTKQLIPRPTCMMCQVSLYYRTILWCVMVLERI